MVAGMVMPLGELKAIYELLFRDGVMVAKKDKRPQSKHPEVQGVTNLQVMKAMGSLKSQGYVRETFAWRHFYWYLTNEGIVYLRDYLRLPPEIVPSTLQRVRRPTSTLEVIRRATNIQTVEGPTSYAPKPTARPGVEKQEFLMDRQGYRHRKKTTLEEEKQAERMPKFRGPPRNVDPYTPRTSWELRSQSLASLKSGQEYHEKDRRLEGGQLKKIPTFKVSQPFNDVKRKHATSLISEERASAGVPDVVPTNPMPLNAVATVTEFTPTEPNMLSHLTKEPAKPSSEPSEEALAEDLFLTTMENDTVQVAQEVPISATEDINNKLTAMPLEASVPTEIVEEDHHELSVSDATQEACELTNRAMEPKPMPLEVDITEVVYDNLLKVSEVMGTEGEYMQHSEPIPPTLSAIEEQTEDLVFPNLVTDVRETLEVNDTEEPPIQTIPAQGLGSTEEEAPRPSQYCITELIKPLTIEEGTANCSVNDEPDPGFEVDVTEPALTVEMVKANEQTGDDQVRLITSENINAKPLTSCGATEAEWMEEEQVQTSEETEQMTPDSTLDGEAPVQVDEEKAEAPPVKVLPLEAKAEATCDSTTPSDVPVTKEEVLVVKEVIEIQHISAKTSQNASESVDNLSNSEVNIDHQEELAIEAMKEACAQDPLIVIQDSIHQKEWPFISEGQQDEVDERI
ncbi:hypothetical protein AAFF_G00383560 [Aldrovandia affinis]|uniref:Plectin/eS10 N-terminal domain-containing protein n=1 Tax=Aldrovandia affinis TaxID=143900 RepID=A0AAD7SFN4_9TELE|nr:hypothetical protein AAFF_G00383560 [Aldrovandia affinis]